MNFVKIKRIAPHYTCIDANDIKLDILGYFLTSDVGCMRSSFKEWALEDSDIGTSSNVTELEKENGYILLRDIYSQEKVPTILKMTTKQFVQILDDWETKVCKARPQEVIIKYQDGQFVIETHN